MSGREASSIEVLGNENLLEAETSRLGHSLCWSCSATVSREPVCPSCVKLQPLGPDSDHFSVMGLPRKLGIDVRLLEPLYHALSRRFHPDRYRLASPRERVIALDNSAQLNQAYRTLRDPIERAAYLVHLEQGHVAQGTKDQPPAALFDRILEIQEWLGEFRFADEDGERSALRVRLEACSAEVREILARQQRELLERLFPAWDALIDAGSSPGDACRTRLVDEMRRLIADRAYLGRLSRSLDEALTSPVSPMRVG